MVRIVIISDTHGKHVGLKRFGDMPKGDILIHAGDISEVGDIWDIERFLKWFADQPYDEKVFIAGNHDFGFERSHYLFTQIIGDWNDKGANITYLENQRKEVKGLNMWGSPVTKPFCGWAFNEDQEYRAKLWQTIDDDTDILITHGPPRDILDYTHYNSENIGCPYLRIRTMDVKPLVHIFGHAHKNYGTHVENGTLFINASTLNDRYMVTNKPVVVDIDIENRTATLVS